MHISRSSCTSISQAWSSTCHATRAGGVAPRPACAAPGRGRTASRRRRTRPRSPRRMPTEPEARPLGLDARARRPASRSRPPPRGPLPQRRRARSGGDPVEQCATTASTMSAQLGERRPGACSGRSVERARLVEGAEVRWRRSPGHVLDDVEASSRRAAALTSTRRAVAVGVRAERVQRRPSRDRAPPGTAPATRPSRRTSSPCRPRGTRAVASQNRRGLRALDAAELVVVDLDPGDAPRLGQHPGLRLDDLGDEDAAHAAQLRVAVERSR